MEGVEEEGEEEEVEKGGNNRYQSDAEHADKPWLLFAPTSNIIVNGVVLPQRKHICYQTSHLSRCVTVKMELKP